MVYGLTDTEFYMKDTQGMSYLYMPLANESIMSSITPDGHGDSKISQDCFLLEPVSAENLHSSMSTRNFWCMAEGYTPWSVFGYSPDQKQEAMRGEWEEASVKIGPFWQEVHRMCKKNGLGARVLSFCPAGECKSELMLVTLENRGEETLKLRPVAAVPIYGRGADHVRDHRHVTSLLNRGQVTEDGVLMTPDMAFDERGHHKNQVSYGVFGRDEYGQKPVGATPILEDFIGEGGSLLTPRAVYAQGEQDTFISSPGTKADGFELIGALWFEEISLLPGESHSYVILMNYMGEGMEYLDIAYARKAFEEMKQYWQREKVIRCKSAWKDFDQWMDWVSLQPHLRRIYGCSFLPYHDYGRGGRGWRDLWQDCLALILQKPETVRQNLRDFFGGVRVDGTNATIIGSTPGTFVADRNAIVRVWMDHGYWPLRTVSLYLEQTGDYEFLLEEKPYFRDKILARGNRIDTEYSPEQKNQLLTRDGEVYQGTLLEHLLLQHLAQFYDVGEHNHMKLHGADWNDALDMAADRGESVAFTAAYGGNLKELSRLLKTLEEEKGIKEVCLLKELWPLLSQKETVYEQVPEKQEILRKVCLSCEPCVSGEKKTLSVRDLSEVLSAMGEWIGGHIRSTELVGDHQGELWFNGYYDNDGSQVEGVKEKQVRMMLTSQVFTILSGTATDEQVEKICHAAEKYLYRKEVGGYRLNTDFRENKMNLGRMFGFAYGHKENGAVFCHMAVMYSYALYSRNFVKEGYQVLKGLAEASLDFNSSRIYPAIPEYFNSRGRGMYSYLTGAGSWMVLTVLTQMYGVRGKGGDLLLEPKLLAEQFDQKGIAKISCSFAGRKLEVSYINEKRKEIGDYEVTEIYINGKKYGFDRSLGVIKRTYLETLSQEAENQVRVFLE